jgi:predicted DNA-binding protein
MKSSIIHTRTTPQLRDNLQIVGRRHDKTMSDIIREAIDLYLQSMNIA